MKANGGKEGGLSFFFLEKIIFRGQLPLEKKRKRRKGRRSREGRKRWGEKETKCRI